jgi:hypothetical protein
MAADNSFSALRVVASQIRLGSGLLGKSAVVIGLLICCVGVAIVRLRSDEAIVGTVLIGAVIFFAWFIHIIRFADKHPDTALLEGAQWVKHQQDQLAAKGRAQIVDDSRVPILPAGGEAIEAMELSPKPPEEELGPNG